jgi:hypothetical protein
MPVVELVSDRGRRIRHRGRLIRPLGAEIEVQIFGLEADAPGEEVLGATAEGPPGEGVGSGRSITGLGGGLLGLTVEEGEAALGVDQQAVESDAQAACDVAVDR